MIRGVGAIVLAGVAAALVSGPVTASDPMGAYCLIEKVVLEPADCPERAQIWGACALATTSGVGFGAASRGYFYYSIPDGREAVVRAEWSDLQGLAGKDVAAGFGGRRVGMGRFRAVDEKPAAPDPHPLNTGVYRLADGGWWPGLLDRLRAARGAR